MMIGAAVITVKAVITTALALTAAVPAVAAAPLEEAAAPELDAPALAAPEDPADDETPEADSEADVFELDDSDPFEVLSLNCFLNSSWVKSS